MDLIIDNGSHFTAIEIKLGSTFNMSFLKGLNFYKNLNSDTNETCVVYGGETQQEIHEHKIIPYYKANYF